MGEWRHDTPWRQGHILSDDALRLLFPAAGNDGFNAALVISHDCDLAQLPDAEPNAEIILGNRIEKLDGTYSHAKNARRLHLSCTKGDVHICVEMRATRKALIEKERLADFQPNTTTRLTANENSILQRWLAARYSR